jgi:uncharacterized protein (TIGR03437 family)
MENTVIPQTSSDLTLKVSASSPIDTGRFKTPVLGTQNLRFIMQSCNPVLFTLLGVIFIASMVPTAKAQFIQKGTKLVGTGAVSGDVFLGLGVWQGHSVALAADGNTAMVGGSGDNKSVGAVWVYTNSGGVWTQQGNKLVGSPSGLGAAMALSADGNTAIVGGPYDNNHIGAAWVYTRSGTVWTQQGKLVGTGAVSLGAIGAVPGVLQGSAVALSADGNTAIVGGPYDNNQNGATWIFTRSGDVWTQQGNKLIGSGTYQAWQGCAVAISADGNTVIIGGSRNFGQIPVNGYYSDGYIGAAWIFTRSGDVWTQQGNKLIGAGGVGTFVYQGSAVALSADGNTAIVGGPYDNQHTGAVWVFTRSGDVWTQQGNKLVGSNGLGDQGCAVAISADGNTAIVGGNGDNYLTGAVWVFTRSGGVWAQQGNKLVGAGAVGSAWQGTGLALSADGNTFIEGGPFDNNQVGAAWVFERVPPTRANPLITAVTNAAGFAGGGEISTGSWVTIFGTGLAPVGDWRTWNKDTEIVNGTFPVSLDGTSVTVNGKPALLEFISPTQVNIQPPDDSAVGAVQVVIHTATGASNSFTANYAKFAPGLFPATSPYIVAQHADNTIVTTAAPAKPGEVIVLWGTGFGPSNPFVPAGQVFSGANPLANRVAVTIGGQTAAVDFAGIVGAGLVQINVHVPSRSMTA